MVRATRDTGSAGSPHPRGYSRRGCSSRQASGRAKIFAAPHEIRARQGAKSV